MRILNFINISSSNKTLTLQSKSAEADEIDIKIPSRDTQFGSSSNTLVSSPSLLRSPSSMKKTPTTPAITDKEIDQVFDTIKMIDEPEEEKESGTTKPPKEVQCLVSFGEANKFTRINVRGSLEEAIKACTQTFNIDESTSIRLDVYDPKVEVYVVAESIHQIKSCKEKLSAKPIKLRMEINKPLISFEEQMGWVEMKSLGSGAFGEVKMVYDKIHSKTMAVKKIHVSKGQKEYKEKIEKEIQVMQSLEHPNIVKCFGYHENGEFFYIMMELMLGGSLKSVLKRIGKGLTEDLIQDYMRQIISALVYIHEELPTHVYHRDLKCDNFLLAGGLIKIADFGEAKVIQKGQTFSQTRNSVVGTLTFCSPEMLKGDPTYKRSHAPDIWSLGMCILEMIFGFNIWEREFRKSILSSTGHSENSDSDPEALYSEYRLTDFILKNLDTLPTKIIPELQVSQELKDLITLCLKANPTDRPLASELQKHKFFSLSIPRGTLKQEILEQFHFFTDECEKLQQKALPTYFSTVFKQTAQTTTTEEPEYSEDYFD